MLKREAVYQELLKRIGSGIWKPGDKLPAEPALCRELGVARVTLRAALEQLSDEGFLTRSRPGLVIAGDSAIPEISRPELYIIPGIERRCMEFNMEMELINSCFLPAELPERYLGAVLLTPFFTGKEDILNMVRSLNVPVVNVHVFPNDPKVTGLPSVLTDYRSAFLAGLAHLTMMGHRKIGFIGGSVGGAPLKKSRRYRSYLETMADLGLEVRPEWVLNCEWDDQRCIRLVEQVYREHEHWMRKSCRVCTMQLR